MAVALALAMDAAARRSHGAATASWFREGEMAMRFLVRLAFLFALALVIPPGGASPVVARDGFPCVDLLPISPGAGGLRAEVAGSNCVERDRFEANGARFLFVDIEGYDPPGGAERQRAASEAVRRAASLYARWFTIPDTLFISGHLPSATDPDTGESSVLAETIGDNYSCVITVEDAAIHSGRAGIDRPDYMRTLAHELFHCVQRTDPSLHNGYVVWRDEGTAEYFSGLAVPEGPPNNVFGGRLTNLMERPIYQIRENAYPFIAYLGRQRSPEAVVDFLRRAARDRSDAGSLATLGNIDRVDELFHDFVKAWFDGFLTDSNGAATYYPIPTFPTVTRVESAQSLALGSAKPFMVAAKKFELARGMAWGLRSPEEVPARASWRVLDESEWSRLSTTIDNCDRARTGVIMATWTEPRTDSSPLTSEATERPADMTACQCPVGRWYMRTDLIRSSMLGRLSPGDLTAGGIFLTFDGSGNATATYEDLVWDTDIDGPGGDGAIRRTLQGTISWKWARKPWGAAGARSPAPSGPGIDALALERTTTAVNANWLLEFMSGGRVINTRSSPFRESDQAGSISIATAVCHNNTLTLGPGATSARGAEIGPPWHGVFERR